MRWTFAAVLAALLTGGCGPSNTWFVGEDFTADEKQSIRVAAAVMAERTGESPIEIVWRNGDDGENRILHRAAPGAGEGIRGRFHMTGESYARTIYVWPHVTGEELRIVVSHELGHHYGIDDHDGPGLMGPALEDAWTEADREACRRSPICGK